MQNPHHLLGIHSLSETRKIIRLLRPGKKEVSILLLGEKTLMQKEEGSSLFTLEVDWSCTKEDYEVFHESGLIGKDPYTFSPSFSEEDAYLFNEGVHYELYEVLGARLFSHEGTKGVKFSVFAPSALAVFVVGDFNKWNEEVNPMRLVGASGVFELFIPGIKEGERYKFSVMGPDGVKRHKADPLALHSEVRPGNASKVFPLDQYSWTDQKWLKAREEVTKESPLNIYEVHLGSWKKKEGSFFSYKEIAHELAAYVKEMGFTHVELLPITEHPLDESWGYQVSGFFAPTSRFGTPEDFQYFVNYFHSLGVGVILDWVPAHFPSDDFALGHFDGTALYEHEHPQKRDHPDWNTYIFNYGRKEVANFLIASALFFVEKMHIDALRVDAVASMLYLDYGRKEGEWIPNKHGGVENLEAIAFLQHLNGVMHDKHPGVLMIAEESTSFPGVTKPVAQAGLGFDLKWNMGWMNDTLHYFKTAPEKRNKEHRCLTFGLLYTYQENFLLPLSHDEVVHCKGSLFGKMEGTVLEKAAQLRQLYCYMMTYPGKKLLFMGGEIGQVREWDCCGSLDWGLLKNQENIGVSTLVKEMNHYYKKTPALFALDFSPKGFSWVEFSDEKNSIVSYLRCSAQKTLLCIHNFSKKRLDGYSVPLQEVKRAELAFCSDEKKYGGDGVSELLEYTEEELFFTISPFTTMILEVDLGR